VVGPWGGRYERPHNTGITSVRVGGPFERAWAIARPSLASHLLAPGRLALDTAAFLAVSAGAPSTSGVAGGRTASGPVLPGSPSPARPVTDGTRTGPSGSLVAGDRRPPGLIPREVFLGLLVAARRRIRVRPINHIEHAGNERLRGQ
jgi:hypothetical protein